MNVHHLKCLKPFYQLSLDGIKPWEVRINDRNYQDGDILLLQEYEPLHVSYTGRQHYVKVVKVISLFTLFKVAKLVGMTCFPVSDDELKFLNLK